MDTKLRYAADYPEHDKIVMVSIDGKRYSFPYEHMDPRPSMNDPIQKMYVDPELACIGVTYFLTSGGEGAVLVDHVALLRDEQRKARGHVTMSSKNGRRASQHA